MQCQNLVETDTLENRKVRQCKREALYVVETINQVPLEYVCAQHAEQLRKIGLAEDIRIVSLID
jgi:hypothetical protein